MGSLACLNDPFGCVVRGAANMLPGWAWFCLAVAALLLIVGASYSLAQLVRKIAGLPGVIAVWITIGTLALVVLSALRKTARQPTPAPTPVAPEAPLPRRRRRTVVPLSERLKEMFSPR